MIELTSRNIKLFAARNYTNSSCLGEEEFNRDFNLSNKIDACLTRNTEDIRKLINFVITYYNVFEFEAATRMLFYNSNNKVKLKTLLVSLGRFPDTLEYTFPYGLDVKLLEILQKEIA